MGTTHLSMGTTRSHEHGNDTLAREGARHARPSTCTTCSPEHGHDAQARHTLTVCVMTWYGSAQTECVDDRTMMKLARCLERAGVQRARAKVHVQLIPQSLTRIGPSLLRLVLTLTLVSLLFDTHIK